MLLIAEIMLLHPVRLAALAVVAVVLAAALLSRRRSAGWRTITVGALRSLVVVLLVVAWAEPVVREQTSNNWIAYIVDQSPSVGDAGTVAAAAFESGGATENGTTEADARAIWLGVGRGPLRQADSLAALPPPADADDGFFAAGRSTLAEAIQRAVARARDDGAGQVVIFTDGFEANTPTAAAELRATASISADIPIHIVPVAALAEDSHRIDRIAAPLEADVDEEFTIRLPGHGGEPVEFLQDGTPLEAAEDGATATARLSRRAPTTITVRTIADDGLSTNNRRSAVVLPAPRKHVLLVAEGADAAEPFARLLRQEEFEVTGVDRREFPPRFLDRDYDAVVLLNVAAGELTAEGVEQLDRFVAGGGGLVTIGGEATFAREALDGAPLARLLPLMAADRPTQQRETRLGVVLVIDNSRSMLEENRMQLAKQAAALAIEPLAENDLLGVIAFGDKSDWVSEMIAVGDKSELRERIDKLEATGVRTIMYPAIRKAFLALAAADVERRNMIILTDGVSAPGEFERIAREMAEQGVRVSTVTVGAGADRTIVQRIADVAGGRHHHAEDPADLPRIVLSEATSAVEEAADEEIRPMVVQPLAGIPLDELPPLARFTATDLRPGGRLYLMSPAGDPLLSIIEIGDGKSLALPVDLSGAAAEQWRRWPGYASLLAQLVRLVERPRRPRETDLLLERHGDALRIRLDASRLDAAWRRVGQAAARIELPQGESSTLPMKLIAPAMYEAEYPLPTELAETDDIVVQTNLRLAGAGETNQGWEAQGAFVVGYDPELGVPIGGVERELLQQVAERSGGLYNVSPAALPPLESSRRVEYQPLWPWFAVAALLLFVAEIGVRRVGAPT